MLSLVNITLGIVSGIIIYWTILYTKNDTYDKINSVMNKWIVNYEIVNEYKKYFPSHYGIKVNSKKGTFLFTDWINKMDKIQYDQDLL